MKIAIVAALDSELAHLKASMGALREVPCPGGAFHVGTIGPHEVALTLLSIGKVNAAMKTQAVIDRFAPDLVINTGIAGALAPDIRVLDTIIGTELLYHDVHPEFMERFSPYTRVFTADEKWTRSASLAADELDITTKKGPITTGDLFVSSERDKFRIREATGAFCVEMEGAAVAHTAYLNDLPFLVLRTISDSADDTAELDYDTFEQQAADRSAKLLLHMLQQPVPEN